MTLKSMFPYYWYRAYPVIIALGVIGLVYMVFCPPAYHSSAGDFAGGLFIGLGIVGAFVKRSKEKPAPSVE